MPSEDSAVVTIHGDGPLTIVEKVKGTAPQVPNRSIVSGHRPDPDAVCDRFEKSWAFDSGWWNAHERLGTTVRFCMA